MFKLLGGVLSPIVKGVSDIFKRKSERVARREESRARIEEARTEAAVHRVLSNNTSDNSIDVLTAEEKRYSWKDEYLVLIFMMPVVVATLVPFIVAIDSNNWGDLNDYFLQSYDSLNKLPTWYRYILFATIIDVYGFRSFARKIVNKLINKKLGKAED